ncbi:MAG: hypothetical protein KF901_24740 [Myxococcales bacterium]|nr:hypothetical protein [Myxococcales bacterium]
MGSSLSFLRVSMALSTLCALACGGSPAPVDSDASMEVGDAMLEPVDIPNPVLVQTMAPAEVRAGELIGVTCVILDANGDIYSSAGRTPRYRVAPEASVERVAGQIVAARVGEVEISCSFPDLMITDESPAIVRIVPGPAAAVTTTVDRSQIEAGESIRVTCDVTDAYGNVITNASPGVGLRPSASGNTTDGLSATLTRAGIYDVSCELPGAEATTARVEVLPSLPATLALSKVPDQPFYATGQVVEVAAVVTDRFDNVVPDAVVSMQSAPAASATLGPNRFRYFVDGTYVVTARVEPPTQDDVELTGQVTIVVNGNGPQIQCTGPRDGDMIVQAPGSTITVTGTVDDETGISAVFVNGSPASVDGNTFSAQVVTQFGINFVDVVARDGFGTESTATCAFLASARYTSENNTFNDVVSLKLRQPAIDDTNRAGSINSLADLLHIVLNSAGLRQQLDATLTANNPLKPSSCDQRVLGVCVFRSEINYVSSGGTGIELNGTRTTSLTLVDGGLRAAVTIPQLRVRLRISGTLSSTGWVTFENVNVNVIFNVALSGGRPRITVRPGSVNVSIGRITTDFSGLSGLIIDIVASLASGTLRSFVETTLRNYITSSFNDVLDGLLAGLDISSLGSTLDVPRLDGSGSIPLGFGVDFSSVGTNPSRLLIGIGTRFTAPTAIARPTRGVAVPPGTAGGAILSDPTVAQSMSVSIHSVLFNQVTHQLWRAGLLQARVTGSGLGGDLPDGLVADIDGALPPVMSMSNGGRAEIGIGSLSLSLVYPGLFDEPITVSLGARASTTVRLVGDNLSFDAIVVDELFFSTADVSLDASTRGVLEGFFRRLVQAIVDRVLNDSLPALPIPSFALPASLSDYGIPVGTELGITSPALAVEGQHFVLRGNFGTL